MAKDKKQRHKAKRQAKKLAARRRDSISPIKRLADARGEIDCWTSGEFSDMRQMQIFAYKRGGGISGVACFLIDQGVVGLKDAWVRVNIPRSEFDEMVQKSGDHGIPMSRAPLETIRGVIAGAVRWTHDNGMRLPKDLTKVASVIGGIGDWQSADVSKFSKEFMGHPDDLRRRLISEPFESYIQRKDIYFLFSDDAPVMDLETGEYIDPDDSPDFDSPDFDDLDEDELDEIANELPDQEIAALEAQIAPLAVGLAGETMTWLAARGQTASTELIHAWQALVIASMLAKAALPDAPPEEAANFSANLLDDFSDRIDEQHLPQYQLAVEQVNTHFAAEPKLIRNAIQKYKLAQSGNEASKVS